HDSTFYLLVSNGDIETLKFQGDSIVKSKSKFPDADKKTNEFETLYYDDDLGLVMLCKNCEDDKKKVVTAFQCKPDSSVYTPAFEIDVKPIAEKVKEDKFHFKPSAAAINPLTKELYILASVNKLLVVADKKGNVKNVYTLDPTLFNQPEGITFTPWGDLLISNEKGETDNATILIFKPTKKG
ncbi:MAG: SdiA-regulated family protein, partial [Bacteroidota bacterium]|nr:SdiA-regulated family protein [Bacteroidota bacterium]